MLFKRKKKNNLQIKEAYNQLEVNDCKSLNGLRCELCGGERFVKTEDNMFQCQLCGCSYPLEKARELLSRTDLSNKSSLADNYRELAKEAWVVSDYKKAEEYCNKVLDYNIEESFIWFIKGYSVSYQSTYKNERFFEATRCYSRCLKYALDEEIETYKDDIAFHFDQALYEYYFSILGDDSLDLEEWDYQLRLVKNKMESALDDINRECDLTIDSYALQSCKETIEKNKMLLEG